MKRHFEQELEGLKASIIRIGSLVEHALAQSIDSFLNEDREAAKRIIEGDARVNHLEMEIDNSIVEILALQQPVAVDLRFILAAQKINNDLERIGDHAVNIAESSITLIEARSDTHLLQLPEMAAVTKSMLRDALDGFIRADVDLERRVLKLDDQVDDMNRMMRLEVIKLMKEGKQTIEAGMEFIRLSRNLERVADLATNIAEEVIFVVQARVVKHHAEDNP